MKSFEIESSFSFLVKSNKGASFDSKNESQIKPLEPQLQNPSNFIKNYTVMQIVY